MLEQSDLSTGFGNTSWSVYVTLSYALVAASLSAFGVWSYVETLRAVQYLKEEGFLIETEESLPPSGGNQ